MWLALWLALIILEWLRNVTLMILKECVWGQLRCTFRMPDNPFTSLLCACVSAWVFGVDFNNVYPVMFGISGYFTHWHYCVSSRWEGLVFVLLAPLLHPQSLGKRSIHTGTFAPVLSVPLSVTLRLGYVVFSTRFLTLDCQVVWLTDIFWTIG